jgi:hypothetical protein
LIAYYFNNNNMNCQVLFFYVAPKNGIHYPITGRVAGKSLVLGHALSAAL